MPQQYLNSAKIGACIEHMRGTMPLPGLCRKLTSRRLFMGFPAVVARHILLPCLALWGSDKPTLHFFNYD